MGSAASKVCFIFFQNYEHYCVKMFFASPHILALAVTIYIFCLPFRSAVLLTSSENESALLSCSSSPSSRMKLSGICWTLGL